MIQWESTMPEDLKQYLGTINVPIDNTSTSTKNMASHGEFKDRIVKNIDVREYIDGYGKIVLLYSFISNDKLIITSSEETLQEIITRLEKSAYVR